MCGIVGYIGKKTASPIILEGLRRLEYRGYDSAGIASLEDRGMQVLKKKGQNRRRLGPIASGYSIDWLRRHGAYTMGHTRSAFDENSHPHTDQSGRIALVHNGVIENYDRLKERLIAAGHVFQSATDTEVLAHLVGVEYEKLKGQGGNEQAVLTQAVINSLKQVIGTYGIVAICTDQPDVMAGARRGSPLIVGIGAGENFLASDVSAMVAHTRQVVYLNDYDVATLTRDQFQVVNLGSDTAKVQISQIEFNPEAVEKGAFPHFMLKEIHEQLGLWKMRIVGASIMKNSPLNSAG